MRPPNGCQVYIQMGITCRRCPDCHRSVRHRRRLQLPRETATALPGRTFLPGDVVDLSGVWQLRLVDDPVLDRLGSFRSSSGPSTRTSTTARRRAIASAGFLSARDRRGTPAVTSRSSSRPASTTRVGRVVRTNHSKYRRTLGLQARALGPSRLARLDASLPGHRRGLADGHDIPAQDYGRTELAAGQFLVRPDRPGPVPAVTPHVPACDCVMQDPCPTQGRQTLILYSHRCCE